MFRCKFVEKGAKHIADLHPSYVLKRPTANASQGKVAGIPSLAALSPFGTSGGIQALPLFLPTLQRQLDGTLGVAGGLPGHMHWGGKLWG